MRDNNFVLPKKGLRMAHLNVCSLRNKVHDVQNILLDHNLHILALSETRLDDTIDNSLLHIEGYSIYRKDRDINKRGVAIYVQSQIPVRVREDFSNDDLEVIWIQVYLPHMKPIFVGSCYRPPDARIQYLDELCIMLDRVSDVKGEIFCMGDLNINWDLKDCSLRKKLFSLADACNLTQVMTRPTRIFHRTDGTGSSTCIDLIFTNVADLCSKAVSMPVGFSDHNLTAIGRKTKVPKAGQKIIIKRMFKHFNENNYYGEIKDLDWSTVLNKEDPDLALDVFTGLIMPIIDKYAPLRKQTVRNVKAPWLDQELHELMKQRNQAKVDAIK